MSTSSCQLSPWVGSCEFSRYEGVDKLLGMQDAERWDGAMDWQSGPTQSHRPYYKLLHFVCLLNTDCTAIWVVLFSFLYNFLKQSNDFLLLELEKKRSQLFTVFILQFPHIQFCDRQKWESHKESEQHHPYQKGTEHLTSGLENLIFSDTRLCFVHDFLS